MNDDPLRWLFSLERLGMKLGLENMQALMRALGEPHASFASVLIAGTNGKGSVTAVVEAGLRAAGYRSARYTSPHLVRLEERFVISGQEVEAAPLREAVAMVQSAAATLEASGDLSGPPTFFEATTAAAFELFRAAAVDIAAVEVGLGGRLDATNVLQPLVTAITTVDFDHQAQLGDTIEAIAAEKAGIIKPGVPVVIGRLPEAAEAVIAAAAQSAGAPLLPALRARATLDGWAPALPGEHQRDNALVALGVLRALGTAGFPVGEEAARFAVERVSWPGRLEHVHVKGGDVLLDAAHNPAGARALAAYLRQIGWTDATLVFGVMADKEIEGMLHPLLTVVPRVVCTTAPSPRAASAVTLSKRAMAAGAAAVEAIEDPARALEVALAASTRVVVAGSIFLIGPLRGILR